MKLRPWFPLLLVLSRGHAEEESRSTNLLQRPAGLTDSRIKEAIRTTTNDDFFKENVDARSTKAHNLFSQYRDEDKPVYEAADRLLELHKGLSLRTELDQGLDRSNSVEINGICPWTNERKPNCEKKGAGPEYRTVDGSCNNRRQPLYGMTLTPVQRLLPAQYSGNNEPRVSKKGTELPNARVVSTTVFTTGEIPNDRHISEKYTQFGQFIDHDIAHNPEKHLQCCDKDSKGRAEMVFPVRPKDKDCFPIWIPSNDTYWAAHGGRSCMHFVRGLAAPPLDCRVGVREQSNSLTHWLDLSNIYGSTEDEAETVRDGADRRLLAVSHAASGAITPSCPKANTNVAPAIASCGSVCKQTYRKCTYSGDVRVNERPPLAMEHIQWIREHNRLAAELSSMNPDWQAERVFQEARRINIGQYQQVIYNEWLPITLGAKYMKAFKLRSLSPGSSYSQDYDESIDPRITNAFAGAAFRFGHAMVRGTKTEMDKRGKTMRLHHLKDEFFDVSSLRAPGMLENSIRGAVWSPSPRLDASISDDLVNHLLQDPTEVGGRDLMSVNIQRGRERGLPGYNRFREYCSAGKSVKVESFDDLVKKGYMSEEKIKKLKSVYDDVDDIDLFVGGVYEKAQGDSILGPTFLCIIGDQFQRLKKGDRFWFENRLKDGFTLAQVNQIRKFSMARLLCDNFNFEEMQPQVFLTNEGNNFLRSCKDTLNIPRMDMDVFRE